MQDPDTEKKVLTPEEMDSLLGPKGEQRHWATFLNVQRSGIDSQIDGLKQKEALASEIVSKGPEAVLQEVAQNLQDSKTKLTKIDQWEKYFTNQEEIDRNFDELNKQKAWLEEEIKGRSLGGTLSPVDEMMGRSKAEVISPKLDKELEEVEKRLKEYKEKIPAELLGQNDQGYDDDTNELIKIAKERREQIAKERKEKQDRERTERERAAREITAEESEEPVVKEPIIETSPPAPVVQADETLIETPSQVQMVGEDGVGEGGDETNTQVESKNEPELLPPTEPTFARETTQAEADRNQGDLPDFLVARQPVQPQPADILPASVPIESVSPVLPRVEESAQLVPEAQQGPKDLLSHLKTHLSSIPQEDNDTSFETNTEEVVDYLKTFELPMKTKIIEIKPVEVGENYIIIEGTADGTLSGKNSFKVKLESNNGTIDAKILNLDLSRRVRLSGKRGEIEKFLKNINRELLQKVDETTPSWRPDELSIAKGILSIHFWRK